MHVRTNSLGSTYYLTALTGDRTEIVSEGKTIIVDHQFEKLNQGWYDWSARGMHIQDAFPFLTPAEREFILTGLTAKDWAELFGEKEEEI